MRKIALSFCAVIFLASCSNSFIVSSVDKNIHLELENLSPYSISNNYNDKKIVVNPFSVLSNNDDFEHTHNYKFDKNKLKITDVLLNNSSILNTSNSSFIQSNYSNKEIELTIKGIFKDLKLKDSNFVYADGLQNQSFVGDKIKFRVLIDESIACKIISAKDNEIKVKFNTKLVPDFYLKGSHSFRVINEEKSDSVFIKFDNPEPTENLNLSPQINSVEYLDYKNFKTKHYDDDPKNSQNNIENILIKGSNFMMYYRFAYIQIDGIQVFGHQTNILNDNTFESVIHLPNNKKFDKTKKHSLLYATPFGVSFKEF